MTEVKFFGQDPIVGFSISGHSTCDEDDMFGKIICSSISSAAYLTANTLIEVVKAEVDTEIDEETGFMSVNLKSMFQESQVTLMGLKIHLEQLAKQYRNHLKVYSEV
ncbi:MAG: ribosomal-processing cysteine protease Prp [Ruminococcaceae bacterium]|nr:ribosomal-processing cysteine protease Prp [Oscillospiraceae bacterium]